MCERGAEVRGKWVFSGDGLLVDAECTGACCEEAVWTTLLIDQPERSSMSR
jgi:hypothetical protein